MWEVRIQDESIRLGQLLKLTGLAEHGGEAKAMISDGLVEVNGVPETRRGREVVDGDQVTIEEETVRVVAE